MVEVVAERAPESFGVDPVRDVQVLAPMYKGAIGIDALNEQLQRRLNPDGERALSDRFRIGDRLIQTRNSHELGLMNGSIVFLREDDPGEERIVVDLDDGGSLVIPYDETATLKLAYAISVHKAQGCEVPVVVGVCHRSHSRMLTRPLLYTAITRARSNCVLVGDRAVLEMAVGRDEGGARHSGLAARLTEPQPASASRSRQAAARVGRRTAPVAPARPHRRFVRLACQAAGPRISPASPLMTRLLPPPRLLLAALLCAGLLLAIAAPLAPAAAKSGVRLPAKKVRALIELRHPGGLDRFVRSVSDPASPRYRHYASVEKLVARYGAKPKTRKRVLRWLRRARPARHGDRRRLLRPGLARPVAGRAPDAARRGRPSRHRRGADRAPGATGAGQGGEADLAARHGARRAGAGAAGGRRGGQGESGRQEAPAPLLLDPQERRHPSGCAAGDSAVVFPGYRPFTPNQYLTAYGHAAMHAKGLKGQGQTVAVVEAGGFKRSDIVTFAHCFGIGKPPPTKVVPVGELKPLPGEPETTLDLSMLTVGAPKLKRIYVYEGGDSDNRSSKRPGRRSARPATAPT